MRQIWYGVGASVEIALLALSGVIVLTVVIGWLVLRLRLARPRQLLHVALIIVLVAYMGAVCGMTLSPTIASPYDGQPNSNLLPLVDLYKSVTTHGATDIALSNVLGNVALFIPLGFLALARWRTHPVAALACCTGFSLAIELGQRFAVTGRALDVNDIVFNATGTLLGFAVLRCAAALATTGPLARATRWLETQVTSLDAPGTPTRPVPQSGEGVP